MPTFFIDSAVPGDDTIVAGVPGRAIAVTSVVVVSAGTVTAQWKSVNPGTDTTELSGPMTFLQGGGYALSFSPAIVGGLPNAYLQTKAGANLILTLGSGSIQVSGHGTYKLVEA